MQKGVPAVLAVVLLAAQAVTSSQSAAPPRAAIDITNADMNYLVIRVDGNHNLPAGYVNPAVKAP